MSEIFKQNSINLVISTSTILLMYFLGFGAILFWFGGLLVIPGIAIWFQAKYSIGSLLVRLSVSAFPWLILCSLGLFSASKTEQEGQRTMNMLLFEMPLYSIAGGCAAVAFWSMFQKFRQQR
jgi:hypothetical protein